MDVRTNLQLVRTEEDSGVEVDSSGVKSVSPKYELAIRAYASGSVKTQAEAAKLAGVHPTRFGIVLNSNEGQKVVNRVRGELDFQYQALYKKYIEVIEMGLDHPEPAVALGAAKLFAQTQIGSKMNVVLTAEDIVKSIMDGTYEEETHGKL